MVQNRVNPCVVGSRSRGEEKLKMLVDDLGRNQKKIEKRGEECPNQLKNKTMRVRSRTKNWCSKSSEVQK
jgi:hypothetical protein